jgi:hypothetical protein
MAYRPRRHPKFSSALFVLICLALPSLSCNTFASMLASPTPTVTPTLTPTVTPTASPTPADLLTPAERSQYLVILRYVGEPVHTNFYKIQNYLIAKGYSVDIDSGPSMVGDIDIILYGLPKCLQAIDDLTGLLKGKLDISGLSRQQFTSADQSSTSPHIVIQIKSMDLFGPGL